MLKLAHFFLLPQHVDGAISVHDIKRSIVLGHIGIAESISVVERLFELTLLFVEGPPVGEPFAEGKLQLLLRKEISIINQPILIEQSLVFADGDRIGVGALPTIIRGEEPGRLQVPKGEMSLPEILDDLERQLILKAYTKAARVKTETARLLGIKTSALYYKLEKYGIE
jgi:hypothetical protein